MMSSKFQIVFYQPLFQFAHHRHFRRALMSNKGTSKRVDLISEIDRLGILVSIDQRQLY